MNPASPTASGPSVVSGERLWRADWAVDVPATLGHLRRGAGDPTTLRPGRGQVVRAVNTPYGPGTLHLGSGGGTGEVAARAWGSPRAVQWLLDGVPELLGALDRPQELRPRHAVLARAHAEWSPRVRVTRTRGLWDALLPAVLEQKVTGQEAFAGYRALTRRMGTPAPGPAGQQGLLVPPDAARAAVVPSWVWLECGIDQARSGAVVRAARVAGRLEVLAAASHPQAPESLLRVHRALRTVPGIGVWTAAEVAHRALGDPDAVSWGDYHVAGHLTWALAGQKGDDAAMARVLAPYVGQRYRVQMLLMRTAGTAPPRRGPRMAPRTHLPVRGGGHTPSGGRSRV